MRGLGRACAGELVGTFLLVLFGTGVVASAVYTGAQTGLWQVAVVWGVGVTLAIYVSASMSGAHLNPAVTLAMALFRRESFRAGWVLPYWGAQLLGAVLAGAVVLAAFAPMIAAFEAEGGIERGAPGSEASAMAFGEYFPNPALFGTDEAARELVSPMRAFAIEALGTALLVLVIFALTDGRNDSVPAGFAPVLIGLTVAVLISIFAPLTQAGWNPARDFGPRLVAFAAGWGEIAIPGPGGGFWVYIAGPLAGGPVGAALHRVISWRAGQP